MILFQAGRQAMKVRLLWMAWVIATVSLAGATLYLMARVVGAPDAGLALGRLQLFATLTAIAVAGSAGLGIYVRVYVTRIALEDGDTILISTLGWVREQTTRLDPSRVEDTGFHEWSTRTVDAPWWTIWLRGRYFPLIVDAQGDVSDLPRLLEALARASRN